MSVTTGATGGKERAGANTLLVVLLIAAILIAVLDFGWLTYNASQDAKASALVTKVQVLSQQLSTVANAAAGGNIDAFKSLEATRNTIDDLLNKLSKGDKNTGMRGYGEVSGVAKEISDLDKAWQPLNTSATKILDSKEQVLNTAQVAADFNSKMPVLNSRMDEVVKILTDKNGSPSQVMISSREMLLADRMQRRVQTIVQGGEEAQSAADGLQRDAQFYGAVLAGLISGNPDLNIRAMDNPNARQILTDMNTQWTDLVGDPVKKLLDSASALQDVKQAADQTSIDSQTMLLKAEPVAVRLGELQSSRAFPNLIVGVLAAAAAIFLVILLIASQIRSQRQRYQVTAELNQRNQEAILRLLDEMGSLAEGDLTVKATVTEDITGAIADSVNFAVEALRSLVTTINDTALHVSTSAQETQATAMHLAEAAEHQAQQITSASAAINEIAVSIDEVSKNSAESADVAQRSVQIASKGAGIVRQTIAGMDSIRDQIQETSKRIKRLGESSQEIGSIVELINDIAEQTNILALNAAIQAASAGEAGRGFAVVADEVQRLAERASGATRRIETLVQTIQADTNEAVTSMEQTTSEVVNGARLAEDAGTALGEIEQVSNNLADLIQNISEAARQQSAAATNISATMNVIQEITTQTSVGASQTAESIGNLAQLAADLRRSVADFKLPA
ncbi:MAG: methyl-accepting chemotaxis protein [Xanthomonadales bacterium PRO7]|jgi:twitching motility protein PilJ|nr:methyl-accepting chemotaxis protein [Xanthomonadales bacterium PRO7]HMM58078.1 methyl-accepting chemotaxis protein [Rudaea sp.]